MMRYSVLDFRFAVLVVVLFLLSGCFYTGDYDKYADTLAVHSVAESERISNQSDAIMETVVLARTTSETESTLLAVIGMMQIERLQFIPLAMKAPTTGMDVLNSAVGYIPFMTMGMTTYKIAEKGFEAAGNVTLTADNLDVSESFNPTENHATGDSNSAAVSTATPTVVEPSVIAQAPVE